MAPKDVPADELYSDDLADLCQEWQSYCVVDDGQETRREMLRRGAIQSQKSNLASTEDDYRVRKVVVHLGCVDIIFCLMQLGCMSTCLIL